jgi:hypothetical protein
MKPWIVIVVALALFVIAWAIHFWQKVRAISRMRWRGEHLHMAARELYGIEPLPGESDEALRQRMTEKLDAMRFVGSARWYRATEEVPVGALVTLQDDGTVRKAP